MRAAIDTAAFLLGCLILAAVGYDVLRTVLAPRQQPTLLMPAVLRSVATVALALARTIRGAARQRLLASYLRSGARAQLDGQLAQWARWMADMHARRTAYPALVLCRPPYAPYAVAIATHLLYDDVAADEPAFAHEE